MKTWNNKPIYDDFEWNGKMLYLTQEQYYETRGDLTKFWAHAVDDDENEYELSWQPQDGHEYDDDPMCGNWDDFKVRKL